MTTSVPQPTFGATGFIAPAESAILAGVQADINAAFGGVLNFSTTTGSITNPTPQGQLAASMAAVVGNVNDTFLYYTTQVDPAYAQGRMQDGIGRIYFIERYPALPTTVQALCTGLSGVTIPVGALTQATDGNIYTCTGSGTISGSGSVTLPFSCTVVGPIPCPAGSLSTIYQSISGWDTVTNPLDGILGQNVETRAQFERRRSLSVAQNSVGSLSSILGAVLNVSGVLDAYVVENDSNASLTVGGVTLAPNSIYVAALGGKVQDVAKAIWTKKAPGCAYNGSTTAVVYDTSNHYQQPYPSYSVSYQIPASLPVVFAVTLKNNTLVPSNANALIQNAIINAFAGGDGGPRASIGAMLFASRFYPPITNVGAPSSPAAGSNWVEIINVKIGSQNTAQATFVGSIDVTSGSMTVTVLTNGTLTSGMTVQGSGGVLPGTTILTQVSGTTGGTGKYAISIPQAVSLGTLYGVIANQDDFVVNINQAPAVSANDIAVLLQ